MNLSLNKSTKPPLASILNEQVPQEAIPQDLQNALRDFAA